MRIRNSSLRSIATSLVTALSLTTLVSTTGCTGEGSDIGPDIVDISNDSFRLLLRRDDETGNQSLGVASARVTIAGDNTVAISPRSGRADFRFRTFGTRNLTIDASGASAAEGDRLAGYTVAVDFPLDDELPYVAYLPDLAMSTFTALDPGLQSSSVTHSDVANSGAVLAIASGSIVGIGNANLLRTGSLRVGHLPSLLPSPPTGERLTSRGILIQADGLTVSPGARLSVPNDLGIPGDASCELFRLDRATGVWVRAGDGVASSSGNQLDSAGGVTEDGLYCFTSVVDIAPPTSLIGQVVDVEGDPVDGVLVRAPQAFATTAQDGRFVLPAIASTDGAGGPRTVTIEFHGGRDLRPVRTELEVSALAPGIQDIGIVEIETVPVFQLRTLLVNRGASDPRRSVRFNSTEGLSSFAGWSDDDARFDFFEIDSDNRISYLLGRIDPQNEECVLAAESLEFIQEAQGTLDRRWFFLEQAWISGAGGGDATVLALDSFGHGLIDDAAIIRDTGDGAGDRFEDITDMGRVFRFNFGDFDGQATSSLETQSDGLTVTSAFSARRPRGSRVELPIQRSRRQDLGAFDPYGIASGSLDGAALSLERRARATRLTGRDDWVDEVLVAIGSDVDSLVTTAPAAPDGTSVVVGSRFEVGVPVPGSLTGYAGMPDGSGGLSLEHLWVEDTLRLEPGVVETLPLGQGSRADSTFLAPTAFLGRDPTIPVADFGFDLALELPGNRVFVDAVRNVGAANVTQSGDDALIRLPARVGPLQDVRYLVALGGESQVGSVTRSQRLLVQFESPTANTTATLLDVPTWTAPAPGGAVPSAGFDVEFVQPGDAAYSVLTLRREVTETDGTRTVRDWTAVVPPDDTSFRFRQLPDPAVSPLVPGNYTLTISSARIDTGPLTRLDFPYERILARWVSISAAEREVAAISSATIPIQLQ